MYIKNLVIGMISTVISILGFILAIWPNIKLVPGLGFVARIGRALLTGLGFLIFSVSSTIALEYFDSLQVEKNWNPEILSGAFCFSFPIALIMAIGSLVWYSRRIATKEYFSRRLDEIIRSSKKHK